MDHDLDNPQERDKRLRVLINKGAPNLRVEPPALPWAQ